MTGEENEAVWLEALDYQDILNSAPDAMVLVDAQGVICLVNKQTEKIFGYAHDELSGEPIDILVPADYSGHHEHPAVQEHKRPCPNWSDKSKSTNSIPRLKH